MSVRGQTYEKQLFTNKTFRHFINIFLNKESGVTKGCELTQNDTTIQIGPGNFCVQGGFLEEDGETELNIPTSAGYHILVYEIDLSKTNTKTEFNQGSYKFVSGVGDYSGLTQEDLDNGGNIYQFEFCRFRITESGLENFQDTKTFLNFDSIYEEIRKKIDSIEDESIYATKKDVAETILFDSDEGLNQKTAVALSETTSNFEYIEILFNTTDNRDVWNSVKIHNANGKKVTLSATALGSINTYKYEQAITVNENMIEWGNFINYVIGTEGISNYTVNINGYIRIFRVLGYNRLEVANSEN